MSYVNQYYDVHENIAPPSLDPDYLLYFYPGFLWILFPNRMMKGTHYYMGFYWLCNDNEGGDDG